MSDESRSKFILIDHKRGFWTRWTDPERLSVHLWGKDMENYSVYRLLDIPDDLGEAKRLLHSPDPSPPPQPLVEVVKVLVELLEPIDDLVDLSVAHSQDKAGFRGKTWRDIPVGILKTLADLVRPAATTVTPCNTPAEKTDGGHA